MGRGLFASKLAGPAKQDKQCARPCDTSSACPTWVSTGGVLQGNLHNATGEGARSWGVDAPVLQRQFYGLPEWWVGSSSGVSFTAVPETFASIEKTRAHWRDDGVTPAFEMPIQKLQDSVFCVCVFWCFARCVSRVVCCVLCDVCCVRCVV